MSSAFVAVAISLHKRQHFPRPTLNACHQSETLILCDAFMSADSSCLSPNAFSLPCNPGKSIWMLRCLKFWYQSFAPGQNGKRKYLFRLNGIYWRVFPSSLYFVLSFFVLLFRSPVDEHHLLFSQDYQLVKIHLKFAEQILLNYVNFRVVRIRLKKFLLFLSIVVFHTIYVCHSSRLLSHNSHHQLYWESRIKLSQTNLSSW